MKFKDTIFQLESIAKELEAKGIVVKTLNSAHSCPK
jgi:hypothetical protein